jgi:signal transduction histidine kinase
VDSGSSLLKSSARLVGSQERGSGQVFTPAIEMRNDEARRAIKVTRRQLDNLARLTDDVFAVGSLIAGNVRLARQSLDLSAVVRFTIQMLETSAAAQSIAIRVTTHPAWVFASRSGIY